MVSEKIMERIQKCLALSRSSNAAEAGVALAMAQRLMEEHKVTTLDLRFSEVTEVEVKSTLPKRMPGWELRLVRLVGDVFHCKLMWRPGAGNSRPGIPHKYYAGAYIFIGLKTQVQIAEYTANVLLRQLRRETKDMRQLERNSYSEGWVAGVAGHVRTFAAPPEQEAVVSNYLDKTYTNREPAKLSSQSFGSTGLQEFSQGHQAGSQVRLLRPVAEGEDQRQLA